AEHGVGGAGHPRRVAVERTAEPGAEHGVDEGVGAEQRSLAQLAIDAAAEREHVDAYAPFAQGPGRDVAVTAVVPLAGHDDDTPSVRATHLLAHRPCDGTSSAFHEHLNGRA